MKIEGNRCATCAHNLNKAGLDCEFCCAGAGRVKTDEDGTTYVVSCGDYERDVAAYRVTFENAEPDFWGDKHTTTIPASGDGLAMTLQKIVFFGQVVVGVEKVTD